MVYGQEPPLKPIPDRRQQPILRRRSVRAELKVPLVVKWTAPDGSAKQEAAETQVVNGHGCLLLLRGKVAEGMTVDLMHRDTQEVRKGRVVCCPGADPDGRTQVGVELDDPDPKFWGQRYVDYLVWEACHPR